VRITVRERREFPDGTILNPDYRDADPLRTVSPGEPTRTLYRFRSIKDHTCSEIERLFVGKEFYFSPLGSLNDVFEGRPDIDGKSKKIAAADLRKLKVHASSALIQSKEFAPIVAPHLHVLGEELFMRSEFIELFLEKYFSQVAFSWITSGESKNINRALDYLRDLISVVCFRDSEPTGAAWGRYGDDGRGICYEIEDSYAYRLFSLYTPKPVAYSKRKPKVTALDLAYIYIFMRLVENWTLTDFSFMSRSHPFFLAMSKFVFAKEREWEHEYEVRVVRLGQRAGGYSVQPGLRLRRVIFGPEATGSDIDSIVRFVRSKGFDVELCRTERSTGYSFRTHTLP
jgi:hypothetical protein